MLLVYMEPRYMLIAISRLGCSERLGHNQQIEHLLLMRLKIGVYQQVGEVVAVSNSIALRRFYYGQFKTFLGKIKIKSPPTTTGRHVHGHLW